MDDGSINVIALDRGIASLIHTCLQTEGAPPQSIPREALSLETEAEMTLSSAYDCQLPHLADAISKISTKTNQESCRAEIAQQIESTLRDRPYWRVVIVSSSGSLSI